MYSDNKIINFNGEAEIFKRHSFGNKVMLQIPTILLSVKAFEDIYNIVDIVEEEVGFLGTVEKKPNGDYLIKEIFMAEQESSATYCVMSDESVGKLANEILSTREDGVQVANELKFFGHSHVNMGTNPSGVDDNQMKELIKDVDDFFIQGIFNKKGSARFRLYLIADKITIDDIQWKLDLPEVVSQSRETWKNDIKNKIKQRAKIYNNVGYNQDYMEGKYNPKEHSSFFTGKTLLTPAYSGHNEIHNFNNKTHNPYLKTGASKKIKDEEEFIEKNYNSRFVIEDDDMDPEFVAEISRKFRI